MAGAWELVVDVADPSGVGRLALLQGNGTLTSTVVALGAGGQNTSRVTYQASCCSPDAELLTVDGVGNVGSCTFSIKDPNPAAQSPGATLTPSCLGAVPALVLALVLVWPAWV